VQGIFARNILTNCAAGWAAKPVVAVELEIDTILESLPFLVGEKIAPLRVTLYTISIIQESQSRLNKSLTNATSS
jgi:hypothetical protein